MTARQPPSAAELAVADATAAARGGRSRRYDRRVREGEERGESPEEPEMKAQGQPDGFGALYNGMVLPWVGYPVAGVLWYQVPHTPPPSSFYKTCLKYKNE